MLSRHTLKTSVNMQGDLTGELALPSEVTDGIITAVEKKKNPLAFLFGEPEPSALQRGW